MTGVGGRIFTVYTFVPFECTMWMHHTYLKKKKKKQQPLTSGYIPTICDIRDPNRYSYTRVHSCIIHNSKSGSNQASINRWMGIQNVADAYNGILFHLKKEEHSDTRCNIKELLRPTLCEIVSESCSVVSDSLFGSVDSSPPGSSICGILQARVLEWVAIPFSKGSNQVSHIASRFITVWATKEAQSEINQSQKDKYDMFLLIWGS